MSGAYYSVQNYTGSRLKLHAVWAITHADLLKYQALLFTVKIHGQIYVPFFQDGCFNWGLKRKGYFNSCFPFLFLICTLLNVQKIFW